MKKLPENVDLISRVHPKGAQYEPAPQTAPGEKGGRPRKKGRRLPGMAAWAEDPSRPWTELAFDQFANRLPKAVECTAPMALVSYSLILAWFHRVGHKHVKFPDRPWRSKKAEPSFGDALTTLRRLSCQDGFREYLPSTGRLKTQVVRLIEFVSLAG